MIYKSIKQKIMKKNYTFIIALVFTLLSINANATTHNVQIGTNGTSTGNFFNPTTFSAVVGDVVTWTLINGVHDVTSTSVPAGAATFASGTLTTIGSQYSYTITKAGTYNYECSIHATSGMTASFTATGGLGIADPNLDLSTIAFPVPCTDKITFKYNGIEKVVMYNVIGEQVKVIELGGNQGTIEMNLDGMPSGIYFYNTYKDGLVYETKKL